MMEFGEKLKQLREEKGMTQQTIAEKLYVTRQAVSRWECGARYPDILTAKKIAQILNVSMDELLSGEELKQNIEKEPVLARPVENILQTVLYTIATVAYLLMSVFGIYSFFPSEAMAHYPGRGFSWTGFFTVCTYALNFVAALTGLILSARNKLTAKRAGDIMCLPYIIASLSFLVMIINMQIKKNGSMGIEGWITDFFIPLLFAVCVWLFFAMEEQRIPYWVILLICILSGGYIALVIRHSLMFITDLGFVVRTVHCLGKIGMVFLLGYQAYIWNQKRKVAYKSLEQ